MNNIYPYDVSVIVPIYNSEHSLRRCINSVFNQNYDFSKIQLILIDNNSQDRSKEICLGYSLNYENIELYEEKNRGVSYARNRGLKAARGKYIMFVDADDFIGKNNVRCILNFFDKHESDVDLVTYHETKKINGKGVKEHIRYTVLKETGIYDLDASYYALQVRINICIKNGLNCFFDTKMDFQEDQKFCTEILKFKRKIGYVKEAEYYYETTSSGLAATHSGPMDYFESATKFFEELFQNDDFVPKYCQALFFHDCVWKFKDNHLWPYHYSEENLTRAKQRICKLLERVEDSIILTYPQIDSYEKLYWLKMKKNSDITCVTDQNGVSLIIGKNRFYYRKTLEVVLQRIQISNDICKIRGFLKSTAFEFTDKPICNLIVNEEKSPLVLHDCAAGYYKVKEKTNTFWGFETKINISGNLKIQFEVILDGFVQSIAFHNMPEVEFSDSQKWYLVGDILVEQQGDTLVVNKLQGNEFVKRKKAYIETEKDADIKKRKMEFLENRGGKVWLYTDAPSVVYDNAYLQFLYDVNIKDGIERYYIITNSNSSFNYYGNVDLNKFVIHGSEKHSKIFFKADKILTSFIDEEVIWPFREKKKKKSLRGNFNADVIYLQHGVLHAHLPWYYSKFKSLVDKFIISTEFERNNLIENYDYNEKDLLCTGMARYDFIKKDSESNKDILFAPSWRSYLVNKSEDSDIERERNISLLKNSQYYIGIEKLFENERLITFLEKNDLYIDLKLHPEFARIYADVLDDVKNERIRIIKDECDISRYKMLITDFSSILYDFVFMEKPILYYIPDLQQFYSGLNHYRELDMPLDSGFGLWTNQVDLLVEQLLKLNKNDFQIDERYYKKYRTFFYDLKSTRMALYEKIVEKDFLERNTNDGRAEISF